MKGGGVARQSCTDDVLVVVLLECQWARACQTSFHRHGNQCYYNTTSRTIPDQGEGVSVVMAGTRVRWWWFGHSPQAISACQSEFKNWHIMELQYADPLRDAEDTVSIYYQSR